MTKDTTAPERIWAMCTACQNWDEPLATPYPVDHFVEYVRADAIEAAQARIAELERENAILRARATGAVFVCPECDIAGCKHYRAALQEGEG